MKEKMRNTMRRLIGIIAAIVMALTLSGISVVPAQAATVTVTINNNHPEGTTEEGPDYHWYVMMWASVGEGNAVSYYVDKETIATALSNLHQDSSGAWVTTSDDSAHKMFSVTRVGTDNRWNVSINNKTDASESSAAVAYTGEEVAAALNAVVDGKSGDALSAVTEQNGEIQRSTETSKTFSINDNGYVLITSSLGTKLTVDTYREKTVNEKNEYPTSTKKQSLTQNGTYSTDSLSGEIGRVVYYHVEITVPNTANKAIRVVDTTSEGLTINTSVSWSATHGTTGSGSWSEVTSNKPTGTPETSKVYEFSIPEDTIQTMAQTMRNENVASTVITLSYSATLNEKAVKTDDAETNKAHIEYDNYVTPDTTVKVYTYKFSLLKYDGANSSKTPLAGAVFTLLKGDNKETVYLVSNGIGKYRVATSEEANNANSGARRGFRTIEGTNIEISGLDKNTTYYLRETSAPSGYNRLTDDIQVNYDNVATEGRNLAKSDMSVNNPVVEVENHQGSVLPSTGGIGTTIFYVIGGVLVAGAVVLLVVRRRRNV